MCYYAFLRLFYYKSLEKGDNNVRLTNTFYYLYIVSLFVLTTTW